MPVSLQQQLESIRRRAHDFLSHVDAPDPLSESDQSQRDSINQKLGEVIRSISSMLGETPLLREAFPLGLGRIHRRMVSALNLRRYEYHEPRVIEHEDMIRTIPAWESDDPVSAWEARSIFDGEIDRIQSNLVLAQQPPRKEYKSVIGRNIDRFRRECGWTFDTLAEKTGLDKKLILGHVNKGKGTRPETLRTYADAFTKELGRKVTAAELEA